MKDWIVFPDGSIGPEYPRTPEQEKAERARRKSFSTKCGHVKRKLLKNERLTGELLEIALSAAINETIGEKLKKGEKLDDYEMHLMIDVGLLHLRLA